MNDSKPSFADYLREVMKAEKISESELSRRSGLAQATVNRILNQTTESLRVDTLRALARGLGLPIENLVKALVSENQRNYQDDRFAFYAERFDAGDLEYTEWQFLEQYFKDHVIRFKKFKEQMTRDQQTKGEAWLKESKGQS